MEANHENEMKVYKVMEKYEEKLRQVENERIINNYVPEIEEKEDT